MATKKKTLDALAKTIADHQANISRLSEAWGQRIVDHLDDADRSLIASLKRILADASANYKVNSVKALDQMAYVRRKIEEIRVKAFVKAEKELRKEAPDLVDNETKWSKRIVSELSGERAARFADLTPKQINKVLENGVIQNKPWADWWTYTADADVQRIANVCNSGLAQGFTTDKIVQLIMGTEKADYTDGVLSASRASARNLARTVCSGLANQAKDEFYRQNDDLVEGVRWLSTLDGRTCPSCGGIDRQAWRVKEPHPVPPLHPSCRCTLLPVLEGDTGEVEGRRPKANSDFEADAKREYEAKHPGKSYDDLAASTRKRYYHKAIHDFEARTGKPAFTQVPGNMTFRQYFDRMTDQQKRDWLGRAKFEMWKSGRYDVKDFIPPYPDKAMTVKQLKEQDKSYFKGPVQWIKDKISPDDTPAKPSPSFSIKGMRGITEQTRQILGIQDVDLFGITDENLMNRMNKALYDLKSQIHDFSLTGVHAVTTLKNNEPAAMTIYNTLELNIPYINNLIKTYSKFAIKNGKYITDTGAMYAGKEIETLIYHEGAHQILGVKIGKFSKGLSLNEKRRLEQKRHKKAVLLQMFRVAKRDGYAMSISKYATNDEKEFFSEAFSAMKLDNAKIPDYIIAGMKEILE